MNLQTLTKKELIEYTTQLCKHRHKYSEHPRCFEIERKKVERIGFLDIESEDLNADYGIIFCWCIKDYNSNKIYEDIITKKDIENGRSHKRAVEPKEDKRVVESLVKTMQNFDRFVLHFGCYFDLPFIRTRAVICGVDYPQFGTYCQTDTWKILKTKFKLSRNSLENGTRRLVGETRKDHLSLAIKHGCLRGEEWALKDTLEHCRKDVLDTQDLYEKIYPYVKLTNTSI